MSGVPPGAEASLVRAQQLLQQGRLPEAEHCYLQALSAMPRHPDALHGLALCRLGREDQYAGALEAVDQALACDPNEPVYHATRARVLIHLERNDEALAAADTAIGLDPTCTYAYTARAAACFARQKWAEAEHAARAALAFDPDDSVAANQLATALRLQGRLDENAAQIRGMLARDPEDAYTHASAGWQALQAGNRAQAEQHFLEALRLDPGMEYAREGLLESFRARSPVYRIYLAYCFRMAQLSPQARWGVIIGAYVLYRFASRMARQSGNPLLALIVFAYVVFALWSHFAVPIGNLLVLRDRKARHALRAFERAEALGTGLPMVLAAGLFLVNLGVHSEVLTLVAITVAGVALPLRYVISNARAAGRWVFGAIAGYILGVDLLVLLAPAAWEKSLGPLLGPAFVLAALLFLAAQFLAGLPSLYRRK